jgi:hypothetical protein
MMTAAELHAAADVEPGTLRHHLRRGHVPGARRSGRVWLIPEYVAQALIATRDSGQSTDDRVRALHALPQGAE